MYVKGGNDRLDSENKFYAGINLPLPFFACTMPPSLWADNDKGGETSVRRIYFRNEDYGKIDSLTNYKIHLPLIQYFPPPSPCYANGPRVRDQQ